MPGYNFDEYYRPEIEIIEFDPTKRYCVKLSSETYLCKADGEIMEFPTKEAAETISSSLLGLVD